MSSHSSSHHTLPHHTLPQQSQHTSLQHTSPQHTSPLHTPSQPAAPQHTSPHTQPPFFSRRRFLQLAGGLALALGGAYGYVRQIEPRWLDVEQITLRLPNLPTALAGRRIAQLSDIHLCQYFTPERLAAALDTVQRLSPDWLVLTGDYVGRDASAAQGLIDPLAALDIPVAAIYGNHDHWSHQPTVERALAAGGVRILMNEAVEIDSGLWLAGIDDIWGGRPDLRATLRHVPAQATTILLAHEPDYFDEVIAEDAPVAVQLSGHSHGGQVRLPTWRPDTPGRASFAPILPEYGRKYPIGLRTIGNRTLYTNRGLGMWPLPYRFNCRPELTVFTLEPAA